MSGTGKARLGILLSGRGSNFAAIAAAVARGDVPAEIVLVVSNRPEAPGLAHARELGLPALALPPQGRPREEYDAALVAALREARVDWVCLAGYMRLLSQVFIAAYPGRILNIHPSLLPAFPGLDAQAQALAYGVKISGCTVHLVNNTLDGGPILLQAAVPVLDDDTEQSLSARILEQEHALYPKAIRMALAASLNFQGRRILAAPAGRK